MDFGKASNLLDAAPEQLLKIWSDPQKITHAIKKKFDGIEWAGKRISRRRRMPDKLAQDEPANSAEEKWRRKLFYAAVNFIFAVIN